MQFTAPQSLQTHFVGNTPRDKMIFVRYIVGDLLVSAHIVDSQRGANVNGFPRLCFDGILNNGFLAVALNYGRILLHEVNTSPCAVKVKASDVSV